MAISKLLRRALLPLALAFATLLTQGANAQDLTLLHVATIDNDTESAILIGMKEGLFRKAGLDIDLTAMNSGAAAAAAVAGNAAQIGQSSLVTLINAHARGIPFTLVAPGGLITSNVQYAAALVRKDSPIKTGSDLNGKIFAVPALQDLNTIAAMLWIDQNGGDSRTVKFVELPAAASVTAIEEGRVDAAQVGTPVLTAALEDGKTRVLAQIFDAFGSRFDNAAWFVTTDYAKANPDVVQRFAGVMRQASVLANTHRAETLTLIADFRHLEPQTLAHMARIEFAEYLDPRDIQPLIDAAAKYKAIPAPFPAQEMISPLALKPPAK